MDAAGLERRSCILLLTSVLLAPGDALAQSGERLPTLGAAPAFTLTRETGAQITVSSLPSVLGDPTQFVQLFQNLIGNALKFRQSGVPPRVQVSAQANPDGWQFTVADNGIGMESQYLKQVFTIFQRLHSRQAYPGNGIGLSVCQKIVESHGGRIWLDSTPGEGTSIHFTLPDRPVIPA